jgi:hypothetical protein
MKNQLTAIRAHCLWCSGGKRNEVRLCPVEACALFPYRFGPNPSPEGIGVGVRGVRRETFEAQKSASSTLENIERN